MKFTRQNILAFAVLTVTGCAAYQLETLTPNHPAHSEAMVAPERVLSKTLAYSPADVPSPQPVIAVAAPQAQEAHRAAQTEQRTVIGEGKVIATIPSSSQLVVEHGEIKGFMDAMTMGYRVEPASLLEGIKPGDQVRFTINVEKKSIVKVERLKK